MTLLHVVNHKKSRYLLNNITIYCNILLNSAIFFFPNYKCYFRVAPPSVSWAQRTGLVLLNIHLEDCKSPEINIQPEKIHFKGKGGSDNKLHEVTMDFYKDIIPEVSELKIYQDCKNLGKFKGLEKMLAFMVANFFWA